MNQALEDAGRATEIAHRNRHNKACWAVRSVWADHCDPAEVARDLRNDELRMRWSLRSEIRQRLDGGFVVIDYYPDEPPEFTLVDQFPEEGWPPLPRVEIEAHYEWAGNQPLDFRMRQRKCLALGIGDAPGSAWVVE